MPVQLKESPHFCPMEENQTEAGKRERVRHCSATLQCKLGSESHLIALNAKIAFEENW